MANKRLSDCFKINLFFCKLFGLWPGKTSSKYYNYYSFIFLFFAYFLYNILLTLNLIYAPRTIELLIPEVIFYFTEMAIFGKVSMMIFHRKNILKGFQILDSDFFKANDHISSKLVDSGVKQYLICWKLYAIFSNFAYACMTVIPLFLAPFGKEIELPICKYYFLRDKSRNDYFMYWYLYQSAGMYSSMSYNVNIDSFISGLVFLSITQLKVINHKLCDIKLELTERKEKTQVQEKILMTKLIHCLKHYDVVLEYNSVVQKVISLAMFMQFGISSVVICVVLCGLTMMTLTTETMLFMVSYLFIMVSQIFVPAWLGTQLSYENQELVFAAYNSDWIARQEKFKRALRLFVERANTPMKLYGLKMFPLDLGTFTSIMKTSYSFFSLVRNLQDE